MQIRQIQVEFYTIRYINIVCCVALQCARHAKLMLANMNMMLCVFMNMNLHEHKCACRFGSRNDTVGGAFDIGIHYDITIIIHKIIYCTLTNKIEIATSYTI